jgi:hypothetical protein
MTAPTAGTEDLSGCDDTPQIMTVSGNPGPVVLPTPHTINIHPIS